MKRHGVRCPPSTAPDPCVSPNDKDRDSLQVLGPGPGIVWWCVVFAMTLTNSLVGRCQEAEFSEGRTEVPREEAVWPQTQGP